MKYILILFFVIGCESKPVRPIESGYGLGLDTIYINDDILFLDTIQPTVYRIGDTFYTEARFTPSSLYTVTFDSLGNIYFKEK